jgi:hypothetical protein
LRGLGRTLGLRLLALRSRGRWLRRRLRDIEQRDAPAIERDFELLVRNAVADVDAVDGAHQVNVDQILRVERKEVLDSQATARAERQAREVLRLHQEVRRVVRCLLGRHVGVADCEPRDARRRIRITFDEHGRDAERAGDVVETEAGIVAR